MKLSDIGQKLLKERKKEIQMMVIEGKFPLNHSELVHIISSYALENLDGIRDSCAIALKKMPPAAVTGFLKDKEIDGNVMYLLSFVFHDNNEILGYIFQHPAVPDKVLEKFSSIQNEAIIKMILINEEKWTKNETVLINLANNPALPKESYDKVNYYLPQKAKEPEKEMEPEKAKEPEKKWTPTPPSSAKPEFHQDLIAEVGENDEDKKRSIAGKILKLSVAEKIKLAMMGNKEVRGILIKDSNKLVSSAALKNPRITEGEVVKISQDKNTPDDLIRAIANDRNWTQNYAVKLNLAIHPKTPVMIAIKFLPSLGNKDLGGIAKSKNVSNIIATGARKILSTRSR